MKAVSLSLAALLALVVAGCATPTPYSPKSEGFGYTSQQLEDNHYRVTFSGNFATPRETVEDYLLYRAAEVTLDTGHDYFVVTDNDLERSVTYQALDYGHHDRWFYRRYWWSGGFFDPFWGPPAVTVRPLDRYAAFATIAVFSGEKPAGREDAYDARTVKSRLGPRVARPGSDAAAPDA